MICLSRLILDPRSRDVARDVADCHALHRTVMSGFPLTTADAQSALGFSSGSRRRSGIPGHWRCWCSPTCGQTGRVCGPATC